jgi:hypothetical protein
VRSVVARLLADEKARAIARSMGCSPTTVTVARDRWLVAGEAERISGAWVRRAVGSYVIHEWAGRVNR